MAHWEQTSWQAEIHNRQLGAKVHHDVTEYRKDWEKIESFIFNPSRASITHMHTGQQVPKQLTLSSYLSLHRPQQL